MQEGTRTVDDTPRKDVTTIPRIADLQVDPSTPLFRVRSFALLFTTRVSSNTANQMLAVAVGWQIYELTNSPLHLGLIGLTQFMPPLLLMLLAGQIADRYNRRVILRCCYAIEFSMQLALAIISFFPNPSVTAIYAVLLVNAIARTFEQPAMLSLLPVMVPRVLLGRAIAAHISAGKLSNLIGPSLGGVLYVFGPDVDYGICTLLVLSAAVASFLMPNPPVPTEPPKITWQTLSAGFRFIWRNELMLGAMSFDLIATLVGGVTSLLPIYARDILVIGPWGAGMLRSAPAVGALITAAVLARVPITRHGGVILYVGFILYGVGITAFGLSTSVPLSLAALMVMGSGDLVSAVVRQTIVQVTTPDDMRGRVGGVHSFFIGCSSQLGSFRAGLMAEWLGAVGSVVVGGCAVFVTVALWLRFFPGLRRVNRPDEAQPIL